MSDREPLSGAEREFEAALGGLRPADPKLDRDALMFRAGQASMRRRCTAWRLTSGVLACLLAAALQPLLPAPTAPAPISPATYATREEPAAAPPSTPRRDEPSSTPASHSWWSFAVRAINESEDNDAITAPHRNAFERTHDASLDTPRSMAATSPFKGVRDKVAKYGLNEVHPNPPSSPEENKNAFLDSILCGRVCNARFTWTGGVRLERPADVR